ncbi:hypothetical protein RRG08_047075 [Elysia crispata]|uniref:Uncharacterized protein n=1 Tax=Elysia crispata TaxID=231223 RepID=A0AAE1E4U8_9GAST|nr:hypothetical protein RRG08_047075 [Elysia crispata]
MRPSDSQRAHRFLRPSDSQRATSECVLADPEDSFPDFASGTQLYLRYFNLKYVRLCQYMTMRLVPHALQSADLIESRWR